MCRRPQFFAALAALAVLVAAPTVRAQETEPAGVLRTAIALACTDELGDAVAMARQIADGAQVISDHPVELRGETFGWRRRFRLPSGAGVEVNRFAPGGRIYRLHADYFVPAGDDLRPVMTAIAGGDCAIHHGRRLVYGDDGNPERLEILDRDFQPTEVSELLNPPVPEGRDPGGIAVALVDSGVNYLLPEITAKLARDEEGRILGYDYWDMDAKPFDSNPTRSPFFPARHGTRVASVLLREAPGVRLVPYRYPRPDLARMADLVKAAAANGVRVINMSLGSNFAAQWSAFEAAARAHPEILFVISAGNNGRDIDAEPVYPAALELPNTIVVTSADGFGVPAPGSNWGKTSVDLLVPGENMPVTDFRGETARSSGSSFAAPRVTAMAARLLARHPDWGAPELKNAILARATMTDAGAPPQVSQGLIADPLAE
jgi:hypothetical protein